MFIDVMKTDETDENDKENSFIKTLEIDKDEVNQDDQCQEYLSSSILFLSTSSFSSISSFLNNKY